MAASTLTAAAACAAWLMGAAGPVLPDSYHARKPGPALCAWASGGLPDQARGCNGVFRIGEDGHTMIVAIDNFGTLVHEACHLVQHAEGRFLSARPAEREAECGAVRARAAECFEGMGAPGMAD